MGSPAPYIPKTFLEYQTAFQNYLIARGSRITNFNANSRVSQIIDAIATLLSEGDVRTLNGFRYSIREGVYNAFGFPRLPGLKTVGIVRIEHSGHTTDILFPIFNLDLFGLKFQSVAPVTLVVGQTYVEIEVRAETNGVDYNITRLSIDTDDGLGSLDIQVPGGTRFWNPADFSGGTELETEENRLKRFQDFILSLGRSTKLGIYTAATSIPGVAGVQMTLNVNPVSNAFEIGWINLYVSDGTSNPPPSLLSLVRKTIEGDMDDPSNFPGYSAAGTFVYTAAVPVIGINCDFVLGLMNDSQLTEAEALVIAINALTLYINTLPVGFDVTIEQVNATLLKAHPDFYHIQFNSLYGRLASDPIPSPLPLPGDIEVQSTFLPRTGGTSGGQLVGEVLRVIPT
ncbi:phage baseplate protein [Leptospira langatensis]|uniref:Phage baseplate protein n=1 Tax=Leptospira langatensis TaxID=2484983 RepID=A0A5R2ATE9_9LEPT|nr:baseplate J/gp47 family protein [Leptospira langatensis]TGJ99840.1 phage baseplate protein [Leptospira langatensis]